MILLDILAVLVLAGSLWYLCAPQSRWQRLECTKCGLTMRFRLVSDDEELRLVNRMYDHIAGHTEKEQDQ